MDDRGSYYQRDRGWHPPAFTPHYKTSVLRSPQRALLSLENTISEMTGPVFGHDMIGEYDNDLIRNWAKTGEAIGPRILVYGRVLDENGHGVAGTLLEFWQANAGGRYRHKKEGYIAALDPNFGGCGRAITDQSGRYLFRTIKPGPYPWPNRVNDWRPAHIHFSIFGHAFAQRLITQMYFEGDPLLAHDPVFQAVPDEAARQRLVASLDFAIGQEDWALGYRFDVVLRGRAATPMENH
jgi:protocatechuate 3,4-dioxygenase, beta subunit